MNSNNNTNNSESRELDYPVKIDFDRQGGVYVAEFLDLPGCFANGETVEEAYSRAHKAKEEWIKATREQGLPIPKPTVADEYSGRVLLRMPTSLHGMLVERAKVRGASLNTFVVHLLSGALVGDAVESQLVELKSHVLGCEQHLANVSMHVRAFPPYSNVLYGASPFFTGNFSAALDDSFGSPSPSTQSPRIVSNVQTQ